MKIGNYEIDFKPEFGNILHIEIAGLVAQAQELQAKHNRIVAMGRTPRGVADDLSIVIRKIESLINKNK